MQESKPQNDSVGATQLKPSLLDLIRLGMTREKVIEVLGPPHDVSIGTRKYPTPAIYKYDDIELHFGPRATDTLGLVCSEEGDDNGITWLKGCYHESEQIRCNQGYEA